MSEKAIKRMIAESLGDIASAIETGRFGKRVKVGLTTLGSEHGTQNLVKGAEMAARGADFDIVLIGPAVETDLETIVAETEEESYRVMEKLLDTKELDGCVTMHYSFPIGVSTVGRAVTPGMGKEMFIATTTGTSATNRSEAMLRNALYGIIAAKAMGNKNPSLGILNLDNARTVERALKELADGGYQINFGESMRADGGAVMRGNDLLTGSVDVMVTDTLTGNILMKVFSSYTTGGSYEAAGYGYGPGIGMDYERMVLILSRASGAPVVAKALRYAAGLAKGDLKKVAKEEFSKAKDAGLDKIISGFQKDEKPKEAQKVDMPEKEVVTGSVSGIDIMDLEDAVESLWKAGIYAESGMGCTGPMVMVSESKLGKALEVLADAGYVSRESLPC